MDAVLVAAVASLPALITSLAALRKHKRTETAIGTPNGMGNVVTMQEATLRSLGRVEALLDVHVKDPQAHQ